MTLDVAKSALWATRTQFAVMGLFMGTWGVHIPSLKQAFKLSDMGLSGVLLASALGTVASLFIAGRVVGRLGTRDTALCSAWVMTAMLAGMLALPSLLWLYAAAATMGVSLSLFDVAMNSAGSELERHRGRALVSGLHGMFSVGGMAGAALTGVLLTHGMPAAQQLLMISAGLALAATVASRRMLNAQPTTGDEAHFVWPHGPLLVIGLLILAGMLAEGVMYDWCVLYLQQVVHLPQAQAAWGYAAFSGAMAAARFGGDALRERLTEPVLLRSGALLAASAMSTVLVSGHPVVALVGFALAGAGLAPVAPILFNAATRVPGVSGAAAIASVTSIGYSGFMIGPPLIGSLAEATSLSWAMSLIVIATLCLAIGARHVPTAAR